MTDEGTAHRRLRLLDVDLELAVPAARPDLLVPYPPDESAHEPTTTPPDARITVRAAGVHWQVVGATSSRCDDATLPAMLLSAVNIAVLSRTRQLAVHAGVVSLGGRSIAFPGGSGAGKSTLTAACLRRGFDYLSDEALCLDPVTALVHPFPRPLALDADSWRLVGMATDDRPGAAPERVVPAAQLGARTVTDAQTLGHVVLLTRAAGTARLAPAPRGDALAALLRHAFNHYRMPQAAFDVVHRAVTAAHTWQLAYFDPLDAAALLRERLSADD